MHCHPPRHHQSSQQKNGPVRTKVACRCTVHLLHVNSLPPEPKKKNRHPRMRACRAASARLYSNQQASKGASHSQQAESVAPPSRNGKQDAALHEQSGGKSSLSAGLIGLGLTVCEGQVYVNDVMRSTLGNISKGDRILEIASHPVGQVCAPSNKLASGPFETFALCRCRILTRREEADTRSARWAPAGG